MTKKEFYDIIDRLIQGGYDKNMRVELGDDYHLEWERHKWYSGEKSGYTTSILFCETDEEPIALPISGTKFYGDTPKEYNYTAEESLTHLWEWQKDYILKAAKTF